MADTRTAVTQFGMHLTLDGYGGSFAALDDERTVRSFLEELPEKLGMHKIAEPLLVHMDKLSDKDPGGYSGVVLIAESHISIHTFPARRFVSADVYTCQNDLRTDLAIRYIKDLFSLQEVESQVIRRGTRYPVTDMVA